MFLFWQKTTEFALTESMQGKFFRLGDKTRQAGSRYQSVNGVRAKHRNEFKIYVQVMKCANSVSMKLGQRLITSHRSEYDVILTFCAHLERI